MDELSLRVGSLDSFVGVLVGSSRGKLGVFCFYIEGGEMFRKERGFC